MALFLPSCETLEWRIACLLSNNYQRSIIEPLQFADFLIILTPKLAKYTNKTFAGSLCGRLVSYHMLITDATCPSAGSLTCTRPDDEDHFFVDRCQRAHSCTQVSNSHLLSVLTFNYTSAKGSHAVWRLL